MDELSGRRIWVAGHAGLVGSALVRRLRREGATPLFAPRARLDLRDRRAVEGWLLRTRPDAAVICAGRVGGVVANRDHPVEFLSDNALIALSTLGALHAAGVGRVLYLGSSCIYPREAPQPMRPEHLLEGPLEPTNAAYALAKILGIKLAEAYRAQHGADFISAMPTNLYGPGDRYHPTGSHVVAGLIRRMHEARAAGAPEVVVWGSGRPRRELLHVDDLADALVLLLQRWSSPEPVNIGSGVERSIAEIARAVAAAVGYTGRLRFDETRPDGAPRKLVDSSVIRALGWRPRIGLVEGLEGAYDDFLRRQRRVRAPGPLAGGWRAAA